MKVTINLIGYTVWYATKVSSVYVTAFPLVLVASILCFPYVMCSCRSLHNPQPKKWPTAVR